MPVLEQSPFAANDSEKPALSKIRKVLNKSHSAKLVGPDGVSIELPKSVFEVLRRIVYYMMLGKAIFVVPEHQELTTQQAADFLGVSRPYLINLLNQRKIPFTMVGTHRRVRFSDLMEYNRIRDAEREKSIDETTQMSQDFGIYY